MILPQICIHDDDEVAGSKVHACKLDNYLEFCHNFQFRALTMNVSRSQSKFRCSWLQQDLVFSINFDQLLGHILSAVRASIVNDNDLVVYFAANDTKT